MVQYLFANDTNGILVDISKISFSNRTKYYCPGCGKEMSAVLGNKKEHHFRHKGNSCSYESYLHKISKLLLKCRFDHHPTFNVTYNVTQSCEKSDCPLRDNTCNTKNFLHTIDLKKDYDICEIEGYYGGFKADLKLSNSKRPKDMPLFLEIVVTHKCTPEKISSGVPIIEIPVYNEYDALEQQLTESLGAKDNNPISTTYDRKIKFYNFDRHIYPEKRLSRFFIYTDTCWLN